SRATRFSLSQRDAALLDAVEQLNEGETPAMLLLSAAQFAELLPTLVGHPGITLGRSQPLQVTDIPFPLTVWATLEPKGEIMLSAAGLSSCAVIQDRTLRVFHQHH